MTKMYPNQMREEELKQMHSTEVSSAVYAYWWHTKLTLEAIDFIWTYLWLETRGKWLLR